VEKQRGAKKIETGPKMLPRIFVAQPETSDNETKLSQIFLFLLDSFFFCCPAAFKYATAKRRKSGKNGENGLGKSLGMPKVAANLFCIFLGDFIHLRS